jgi:SulP family sulfate permease
LLFFRSSRPRVTVLGYSELDGRFADLQRTPDAVPHPEVLTVRVEGPLWHANAQLVLDAIRKLEDRSTEPPRAVVLDLEETPLIDITTLERLSAFAQRAHREERFVVLARVRAQAEEQLRFAGILQQFDAAAPTVEEAVEWAAALKDHLPPPRKE